MPGLAARSRGAAPRAGGLSRQLAGVRLEPNWFRLRFTSIVAAVVAGKRAGGLTVQLAFLGLSVGWVRRRLASIVAAAVTGTVGST